MQLLAEVLAARRVDVECTGDQLEIEVAQRCRAMDIADLAAAAAADHAPADGIFYTLFTVIHQKSSLNFAVITVVIDDGK